MKYSYKNLGEKNSPFIIPYIINDGKKHPFAIVVPGGGYHFVADPVEGKPYCEFLNEQGINAFELYYRVAPDSRFPNPFNDLVEAIKTILDDKDKFNLDVENYSIWGSSAGGHLTAYFASEWQNTGLPKPGCIVLCYPVISFGMCTHLGTVKNLLGENQTQEQLDRFSIEKHVTNNFPRTFFFAGDDDDIVPVENSVLLDDALNKTNVPHIFKHYYRVGHGCGLAKTNEEAKNWPFEAVDFWRNF